jgi:4'-phosphopantetheinyl transferase
VSLGTGRDGLPLLWLFPSGGGETACLSAPERRWSDALPPLRRRRYRHSRTVLRQVLAGVLRCAPAAVPLHSPPGEPPRLKGGKGWISLSHGGDGLLIGYSREPIGVDLEPVGRPLDPAGVMRRFFPSPEQAQLERMAGEGLRDAVLTSWVLKEAAIKWRQRTLAAELSLWCYDHRAGRLHHLGDGAQPECRWGVLEGWRWGVVGQGCREAVLERWL